LGRANATFSLYERGSSRMVESQVLANLRRETLFLAQ
jgi:hypothetical protein